MSKKCPNCGACPECGSRPRYVVGPYPLVPTPYRPYGYPWTQPFTYTQYPNRSRGGISGGAIGYSNQASH